ncbi:MAG: hypothetical protein ABIN25_06640 [Ginsengibacter sp.]
MDIFDTDLINFWKSLNQHDVKYIMIGGFAVNLHGFLRTTADVDLWLKNEIQNRKNIGKALKLFGYENISFEEALQQANIAQIYDTPVPFLHINQLIKNKKATNRPKDMIDVIELEKILKIRQQKDSL